MTRKTRPKKAETGRLKDVQKNGKTIDRNTDAPSVNRNDNPRWTNETLLEALLDTQKELAVFEPHNLDKMISVNVAPETPPVELSEINTQNLKPFSKVNTGVEKRNMSRLAMLQAMIDELPEGNEIQAMREENPLSETQPDSNKMKQLVDFLIRENTMSNLRKRNPVLSPEMRQNGIIPLWEQLAFRSRGGHQNNIDKTMMLADVQRGLEAREFLYLYQPQWNIETGELESLETFLKWRHPKKGMLGSDFFITLFEEAGLIEDLLRILIEQLLIDRLQLELNGIQNVKMGIKLTPEQLEIAFFADRVLLLMEKMNVQPKDVECVLTERNFSRCPCSIRKNLQAFQQSGINLVIDNFGSGFSAYPYLLEFSFDKIKLDKSYITHLFQNPRGQLITQSVIHMAHILQADVIIDGIDNIQTLKWVRLSGGDIGQGCYLGAPMPIEELIDFLKEYRTIASNGIQAIEDFWSRRSKTAGKISPDCR